MNEENHTNIENNAIETPVAAPTPVEQVTVTETPVVSPTPVEQVTPTETPVAAPTPVEQVTATETPVAEPTPVKTSPAPPNNESKKDNSTAALIIAILLLIGAVCFVVFMPYIPFFKAAEEANSTNSGNSNAQNTTDNNKVVQLTANDYVGIYTSKEGTAYLFTKDGTEVEIDLEVNDYIYVNHGEVKGGKIVLETLNEITTLSLSEDKQTLSIVSDKEKLNNVKLTKSKGYSKEEYFERNYGSAEYLTSKYSGQYTLDKKVLYLYQVDESTVKIANADQSYSFETAFDIQEDGSLYSELFDDKYKVTFNDNKLTFETVEGEKLLDGTYTKTKDITIDDVIKYFVG